MAKSKKMTPDELSAVVSGYIDQSVTFGDTRAQEREKALEFFNGEVDFPPMTPTGSKMVSRDISDTHGLMMPGLKRVFFASDRLAIYEPTRPEYVPDLGPDGRPKVDPATGQPVMKEVSQERADQASDLINYVTMKECDGYRHFSNAISDALLLGNGIVKHWWDASEQHETDTYSGLDDQAKALVLRDPHIVEVLDEETYPDPDFVPPDVPELPAQLQLMAEAGDPQAIAALRVATEAIERALTPPMKHDFKVKRLVSKGRLRLMAMPNEEFIIDSTATVLDETCRMAGHRRRVTRSDLIEEGYSRDKVDALPSYDAFADDTERRERNRDDLSLTDPTTDKSTEYVEVYEVYPLVDYDGDGIAERRRVVMAGESGKRSMLANEEWGDDLPFSDLVPDPQPHAWRGRGLYDKLADLMRIKTVLLRGALDNTYQQLAPQQWIEEESVINIDEVYNPTQNGVIIGKTGKQPPQPVNRPQIVDKLMPMVDYMDGVSEKRTGISPRSQALDIDALANQSATAVNAAQSAAYAQIEDIARNIAECGGMKRIFRCLYRLMVSHQDRAKTIRLRDKWVDIDPSAWASDMDVTVNTGLGTGSRDRDLAMLGNIFSMQKEAMIGLGGPTNPVLGIKELFGTARKMAEAAGIRNPEVFFPEMNDEDMARLAQSQQQKGPDPKVLQAQAQIEADKAKAAADIELQQQKQAAEMQLRREQAEFDAQQRRQEAQDKLQFMRDEAAIKAQLRRDEMALEAELTNQANQMKAWQGVNVAPDVNINGPGL